MLKINGLSKNFGTLEVLKDLNLQINDGAIFGLVGINGAGKSTLLRIIAGVYEPEGGSVCLDDCNTYENALIRKKISFVSDDQYYQVGATIKSTAELYRMMYDFDDEAYHKYLQMFELNEDAAILNLSKGNKRRVDLLFALSVNPKLLLLDEAYDGLEPLARLRFKQVLIQLVEQGMIVIISSHNLKELEDICDSFGILENGRILEYGDLAETKEKINKYQVVFEQERNQDDFKEFNLMHLEHEGRVYKMVIKGNEDEVMAKLHGLNPMIVDVLPVNFEELFIYELEGRNENYDK